MIWHDNGREIVVRDTPHAPYVAVITHPAPRVWLVHPAAGVTVNGGKPAAYGARRFRSFKTALESLERDEED